MLKLITSFKKSFRKNKRAIMGIGTLIIFIATILVAAVAAGVLISTSGVLQQRALITGQEARKKITNAIEIISILAHGNTSDESLNNFEMLVRLDAGSDPIQMKKFDLQYIGPSFDTAADLMHYTLNNPRVDSTGWTVELGEVSNSTPVDVYDMDDDGITDTVIIYYDNITGKSVLLFNMTSAGLFNYSMEEGDFSRINSTNEDIKVVDEPIIGDDGLYYGYFTLNGTLQNNTIPESANFNISKNFWGDCSFDLLAPETDYCFQVMHGNDDVILGDGEVFKILFKLRDGNNDEGINHKLYIGQEFRFIFSSEKGRLSQAQTKAPDVITSVKVPLWPVG